MHNMHEAYNLQFESYLQPPHANGRHQATGKESLLSRAVHIPERFNFPVLDADRYFIDSVTLQFMIEPTKVGYLST